MNFEEEKKDFYLTLGSNTFAKKEKERTFYHIYIGEYNGFGKIYDFEKKIFEQNINKKNFSGHLSLIWRATNNEKKWSYYYAALPRNTTIDLPIGDYDSYYLYGFLGRLVLPGEPEGESLFGNIDKFVDSYSLEPKYATGEHNNFYYYIVGRKGQKALPIWYKQKNWVEVEGIEITGEQFEKLACFSMHDRSCKPFLNESTPNLTKAQRDYIKRHPVSKDDFSEMIEYYKNLPNNPWK